MESSFFWTSAFQMMGRLHLDFQREEYNVSLPGVPGQPLVSDFCVEALHQCLNWAGILVRWKAAISGSSFGEA